MINDFDWNIVLTEIVLHFLHFLEILMFQSLLSREPIIWIKFEQFLYQIQFLIWSLAQNLTNLLWFVFSTESEGSEQEFSLIRLKFTDFLLIWKADDSEYFLELIHCGLALEDRVAYD